MYSLIFVMLLVSLSIVLVGVGVAGGYDKGEGVREGRMC